MSTGSWASRTITSSMNMRLPASARRPGDRIAIEVETGKSDIQENLAKLHGTGFDRIVFLGTLPSAVSACHRAMDAARRAANPAVELMTWLDVA